MSCWGTVTSPGCLQELRASPWMPELFHKLLPAPFSPPEISGTSEIRGALLHLRLETGPAIGRHRRRTSPAEGWSASASLHCCFLEESWVSWACPPVCSPLCHGGAGGRLLCGIRRPDGLQPAAQLDDGAPLLPAGVWAAVGSAAGPAAHASEGRHI